MQRNRRVTNSRLRTKKLHDTDAFCSNECQERESVMIRIRWHGRGGQGAVTAARIFGLAVAKYSTRYAQSFPAFGVERRGAPVLAFTKIDEVPILDRSQILEPDIAVVLDSGLLSSVDVASGLQHGGIVCINSIDIPPALANRGIEVIAIDATNIALEILGRAITNTAMVGVLGAITDLASLESLENAVRKSVPSKVVDKNVEVLRIAYNQAKVGRQDKETVNE